MTDNEKKVCESLDGAGRTCTILRGVHMLCVIMSEAGRDGKISEQLKKLDSIKEAVRKALLNSMLDGQAVKDEDHDAHADFYRNTIDAMAELVDLLDGNK